MQCLISVLGGVRSTVFASLFVITLSVLGRQIIQYNHQHIACLREKQLASQAIAHALVEQRALEQRDALQMAAIGEQYEQIKAAANDVEAKLLNRVHSGALQLRRIWSDCGPLPQTRASPAERDAASADRAALAAAVIRAGRDADDQIKACQAVIKAQHGQ